MGQGCWVDHSNYSPKKCPSSSQPSVSTASASHGVDVIQPWCGPVCGHESKVQQWTPSVIQGPCDFLLAGNNKPASLLFWKSILEQKLLHGSAAPTLRSCRWACEFIPDRCSPISYRRNTVVLVTISAGSEVVESSHPYLYCKKKTKKQENK